MSKMTYFPNDVNERLKAKYRDSSISIQEYHIKKMIKAITRKEDFDEKILQKVEDIETYLSTIEKATGKRDVLNSIIAIMNMLTKKVDEEVVKKYEELRKIYTKEGKEEVYSRESKALSEWTIAKIGKKVLEMDTSIMRLIIGLYAYMPALRTEDWTSLRRYEGETVLEGNNLNLGKGVMEILDYKTSETHGKRIIVLSEELKVLIREYYGTSRGEYFLMKGEKRMTSEELQRILRKTLGISSNELRKIYISEMVPYLSKKERMKLGTMMGHSIEMQEFVYRRENVEGNEEALNRLRKQMETVVGS